MSKHRMRQLRRKSHASLSASTYYWPHCNFAFNFATSRWAGLAQPRGSLGPTLRVVVVWCALCDYNTAQCGNEKITR
ncbi:hypothetical protein BDR05DRAFT_957752 [Suillus weaverae]|nr:hypothetical protein BDR05DRAFT_957752 [Suillus weaverae]